MDFSSFFLGGVLVLQTSGDFLLFALLKGLLRGVIFIFSLDFFQDEEVAVERFFFQTTPGPNQDLMPFDGFFRYLSTCKKHLGSRNFFFVLGVVFNILDLLGTFWRFQRHVCSRIPS